VVARAPVLERGDRRQLLGGDVADRLELEVVDEVVDCGQPGEAEL
jgi:hypothetical protein